MGLFDEKNKGTRDEQIGNLQSFASKRREKLMALKKSKMKGREDEDEETEQNNDKPDNEALPTPQVMFR